MHVQGPEMGVSPADVLELLEEPKGGRTVVESQVDLGPRGEGGEEDLVVFDLPSTRKELVLQLLRLVQLSAQGQDLSAVSEGQDPEVAPAVFAIPGDQVIRQ